MRLAFEKSHGKAVEARHPGITIIELMEVDLEAEEFSTPQLNEIPSRDEAVATSKGKSDAVGLSVTFSTNGAKLSQPIKVKLMMPHSTEEFRDRFRLLFAAIEFIKAP